MASEVVMPSPSWPVASQILALAGLGPMSGSLSGVVGRKPVQARDDATEQLACCDRREEHFPEFEGGHISGTH